MIPLNKNSINFIFFNRFFTNRLINRSYPHPILGLFLTNKTQIKMKTITLIFAMLAVMSAVIFMDACKAEKGDVGPAGPAGPTGTTGATVATGATGST